MLGDAFGGVSVPWHLNTRETVREIARVLTADGIYVINLLDYGPLAFARAEVATLADIFDHVALATETDTLTNGEKAGGNLVVIASNAPLNASIAAKISHRGADWDVITGAELTEWTGDAAVLTDDYAPVDQLLTRTRAAEGIAGRPSFWLVVRRSCDAVGGVEALVHEVRDHAVGSVFEVVAVVHPNAGVVCDESDVVALVGCDVE